MTGTKIALGLPVSGPKFSPGRPEYRRALPTGQRRLGSFSLLQMQTLLPTDLTPDNCLTFSREMVTAPFRYKFQQSDLSTETVIRSEIGYTER